MRQLIKQDVTAANDFNNESTLTDHIHMLNAVNEQIALLALQKESLTASIIKAVGHTHEGQKSYNHDVWKIEVKTPLIYSLNKKVYEASKESLNAFNPVKESIAYTVDKKLYDKFSDKAPTDIQELLSTLVDKKPSKPSVCIKSRSL